MRPELERVAVAAAGLVPMPLDDKPCWGIREEDGCISCTLRQLPEDYLGSFPDMKLKVPQGRTVNGQFFCPNRRSAGTASPGLSVGRGEGSVCAETHGVHGSDSPLEPWGSGSPYV